MTRNEAAIKLVRDGICNLAQAHCEIDVLVSLGVLKLDEPQTIEQKFDALLDLCVGATATKWLFAEVAKAGLVIKVIERQETPVSSD